MKYSFMLERLHKCHVKQTAKFSQLVKSESLSSYFKLDISLCDLLWVSIRKEMCVNASKCLYDIFPEVANKNDPQRTILVFQNFA